MITELDNKIKENIKEYNGQFPNEYTTNNKYSLGINRSWTEGFWNGILWLMYELTQDETYYEEALKYSDKMCERINSNYRIDNHDIGFLSLLSIFPAYKFERSEKYKYAIKKSADILYSRFHKEAGYIQAWGEFGNPEENRLIVDSLMNIPLLFKASDILDDKKYETIARIHIDTVYKNILRDDNTTHHTVFMDNKTGHAKYGETNQGNSDTSCWARGQAWAITGMCFNMKYMGLYDKDILDSLIDVIVDNLPKDNLLYWDFDFNDQNPSYRDSSSNAIILCGLNELGDKKYKDLEQKLNKGVQLALNLNQYDNNILDHGVYNIPQKKGIDSGNLWGDYFYLEYIVRTNKSDWKPYF